MLWSWCAQASSCWGNHPLMQWYSPKEIKPTNLLGMPYFVFRDVPLIIAFGMILEESYKTQTSFYSCIFVMGFAPIN